MPANRPNVDQSSRDALEDLGLPGDARIATDVSGNRRRLKVAPVWGRRAVARRTCPA